jgi:hypothetical protein
MPRIKIKEVAMSEGVKLQYECESIPPARAMWIGILKGSWKEMGIQYGERTGKDIRRQFDILWEDNVLGATKDTRAMWQKAMPNEKWPYFVLSYLCQQAQELSYFSPEIIEFWEGIAKGAEAELEQCVYAKDCTHFEKIAFINSCPGNFFHPGYADDCNGFWVKGEATKTGETYGTLTKQGGLVRLGSRQIAYVGIPKDPKARVFWAEDMPGRVGGGAGVLNDCGVCLISAGAQYKEANERADETLAPGIRDNSALAFYAVIFSKSAREAADKSTIGTPRYRSLTNRKTVLRARGCNLVFADANECYCVEQNALHYAIRTPGYIGEKRGNYLVIANHFNYKEGSYDENNRWHADKPMADFCPVQEGSSTYYRFWSGMWMLHNNYGKIDREMFLRELVSSHIGYDEEGNRYDPNPDTGIPSVPGTFCSHFLETTPWYKGDHTEEYPLGIGGNYSTGAFVLTSCEVYWVPAWPCHYKNKAWNHFDLKPLSEYRRLLWGY